MATTQEHVEEQAGQQTPGGGERHRSLREDVWRQFKKHKGAVVGLILLTFIVFATVFGPVLYGVDPYAVDTSSTNAPPSAGHPFGTDNLGRDVLARVLVGGRISLSVGFAAMLFGLVLGSGIGILSGYFSRPEIRILQGSFIKLDIGIYGRRSRYDNISVSITGIF
jgi:ABC-type dipeptide/oligopeptide/nickel transport system permease subunit